MNEDLPRHFHRFVRRTQDGHALFQAYRFTPATIGIPAVLKPWKGDWDSNHDAWLDFPRVKMMLTRAYCEGDLLQMSEAMLGMENSFRNRFDRMMWAHKHKGVHALKHFNKLGLDAGDHIAFVAALNERERFTAVHVFDKVTDTTPEPAANFLIAGGHQRHYDVYTLLALQLDEGRVDTQEIKRAEIALHEHMQASPSRARLALASPLPRLANG